MPQNHQPTGNPVKKGLRAANSSYPSLSADYAAPVPPQCPSNKLRGRPVKYSPFDRLKLAISAAKGTSISQVGVNYAIFKASSIEDLRNLEAPSRTLVTQALAELNQCFKRELAKKFSSSTSLNLGIDATTDSLAISFG